MQSPTLGVEISPRGGKPREGFSFWLAWVFGDGMEIAPFCAEENYRPEPVCIKRPHATAQQNGYRWEGGNWEGCSCVVLNDGGDGDDDKPGESCGDRR